MRANKDPDACRFLVKPFDPIYLFRAMRADREFLAVHSLPPVADWYLNKCNSSCLLVYPFFDQRRLIVFHLIEQIGDVRSDQHKAAMFSSNKARCHRMIE